jgi:hypothetical protein
MNGSACICLVRWPRLYVVIESMRYEVEPAEADSPQSRHAGSPNSRRQSPVEGEAGGGTPGRHLGAVARSWCTAQVVKC